MIRDEQQQNPLSSFLKRYKEAIISRIVALNTEKTEQSSESESSDDSQSVATQTSSDVEIHMVVLGVKTEEFNPMDTNASPSASTPPPFQINSGKHYLPSMISLLQDGLKGFKNFKRG
ncbi:hypothetical protein V6N11_075417 [Hibiscus sabdariffa]|uniref:Uncharacterized protein n=1 Tax=Hibiscus sabdariffa TaxID=183260 RepID=A0ABR2R6X7_9ROSI